MIARIDPKRQKRAAFTLMEMLVVVAIIVALAGIGGFFLFGQLMSSKMDMAQTQVKTTLTNACQSYYLKHQKWPDTLDTLTVKDEFGILYLEKDALMDPWQKRYNYDANGTKNEGRKPDIWTSSPPPENIEIGNWSKIR